MKDKKHIILVPTDFTEVGNSAIEYAISFSKVTGFGIAILHVIEKPLIRIGGDKTFDNKIIQEGTIMRLEQNAKLIKEKHNIDVEIIAKPGNIFDTINDVAEEIDANLVIMGTHGVKGIQRFVGSNALRVIYDSEIPFIVVQNKVVESQYNDIVVPIDFRRESKEKIVWSIYIAQKFNAKIHLLYPTEKDPLIKKNLIANLAYTQNLLEKNNVEFVIKASDKDSEDLADETIKYAKEVKSNLIVIMTYPKEGSGGAAEFFLTPDQQNMITNKAQIPVMCINPRKTYISYSKV